MLRETSFNHATLFYRLVLQNILLQTNILYNSSNKFQHSLHQFKYAGDMPNLLDMKLIRHPMEGTRI